MRASIVSLLLVVALVLIGFPTLSHAGAPVARPCVPERPIPPESVGSISLPFDVPIWPTLLKTEFNILPWLSFGKASICLPGSCKAIQFPAPYLSLKPIPIWIPWLRPLDIDVRDREVCAGP